MLKSNNIWISCIIVFLGSACSLIIELVAGRIMAPYVGVSLYTWTSIIGVVLAGVSIGNYLGGKIADKWGSRKTLGYLLLVSGILSLSILLSIELLKSPPFTVSLVPKILFLATAIFFPPSCVLGMISPIVVKLTLEKIDETGNIVGKIYAFGALGSIVGTFLTGFILIALFGTRTIVFFVAVILVLMSVIFGDWRKTKIDLAVLLVFFAAFAFLMFNQGKLQSPFLKETNYYTINVNETNMSDGTVRKELVLDHLIHSYSWVDDPTRLEYGYEKIYADITKYAAQGHPALKTLFIGGGGYTFPRYIEAVYPGSQVDVVEIDPEVTRTAYEYLGLRPDSKVRTFNEDARMFFDKGDQTGMKYNLIMGDAFNDLSVPYHLTTAEFDEKIRQMLEPDGFYMANVIDNYKRGEFLRAFMNSVKKSFKHVYLLGLGTTWDWDGSSTYIVLAGNVPLDEQQFQRIASENGTKQVAGTLMPEAQLNDYLQQGRALVLTDDYVPVDNLMAPRFIERGF